MATHITNWQEVAAVAIICITIVLIVFIVFLFMLKGIDKIIEYKKEAKQDSIKKVVLDYLKSDSMVIDAKKTIQTKIENK